MHTQHTRKRHAIATPTSSSSNFSVPPMIAYWWWREGGAWMRVRGEGEEREQ